MAAGRLDVLLALDAARFVSGLDAARKSSEKFESQMLSLGKKIGAAIGGALSARAFVNLVQGSIDAADKLNDLSKQTGVAVTTLGGLGFAATQAGGDLDSTVEALGKLNKNIAEAAAGNEKALEFFQKLKIDIRDSNKQIKDAGTIYLEVADKFEKFADGPNKSALALRGFGKAGQAQIAVLNEGGEQLRKNIDYWKRFSGVTEESAKQADEFNDTMGKLGVLASALGQKIAIGLLPLLQRLGNEFQQTGEDGETAFDSIANGFSNFFRNFVILAANVKYVLGTIGKDITERAKQLKAFFSGDFAEAGRIGDAIKKRGEEARAEIDRFSRDIANAVQQKPVRGIGLEDLDAAIRRQKRRPDEEAPGLRDEGSANKAAALAKKQLDTQLSQLENFIKAEERLLDARNASLDRLYDQDRISINAYFDQKNAALDRNTFETVALYNEQIQALQDFAKSAKEETVKLDALAKAGDIAEKRSDFLTKRSSEATRLVDDRKRAARDYSDQVSELNSKLLDMANNENAAAQAALNRFNIQNRQITERAVTEGDVVTLQNLERLRQQGIAQARVNTLTDEARVIQDRLQTMEARLLLERDLGLRGELESLHELGVARKAAVPDLQRIADRYLEIAKASGDPKLLADAEAFNQKIKELAASADVLAQKFNNMFIDSFSNAFAQFLDGTLSAQKAFKAFTDDIVRQINRIAAQEISRSLFGNVLGGTGGGGIGGIISGLFGAGGQNLSGVFASGTDFVPRDMLAYVHRGEKIVPAHENRQSTGAVNMTFVLPPGGYTRATQTQIASETARTIGIANRRNG